MSTTFKVIISIVVTAAIIGGGGWYFMNKKATDDKAKLQTQIDGLYDQIKDLKSASTTASTSTTATTTTPATPSTTAATDPYIYTNSTYGFSLTFNSKWKGYEVAAVASDQDTALKYLYACVPTTSTTWPDKKSGMFCPFAITVVKLANKSAFEQANEPLVPTFILSNDSYSFYYSTAQDRPSDGVAVMNDIKNIIETFK